MLLRRLPFAPLPLERLGPLRREPIVLLLRVLRLKPPRLLEECEPRVLKMRAPPPPAPLFDRRAIPSPRNENRENRMIVRANAGLRKK